MSGFFGAIAKQDCVYDVFYGTDYHSHLGTKRAGMVFYNEKEGFRRSIHSLEDGYFRSKFEPDLAKFSGHRPPTHYVQFTYGAIRYRYGLPYGQY
jgi:amidophosphoribosyltransferase